MPCKNCKEKPVISLTNSNIELCKSCFFKYFEKKVRKTISKYNLIEKKEKIAVACSGGKDSMSLLYLLNKLAKKREIEVVAVAIDEGIKNYRDLKDLKKYCKENNIEIHVSSFKNEFGFTLDQAVKKIKNINPCSICGVLRRRLLNKAAHELKADKLTTGHNIDDESQSVMMNYVRGNLERSTRLGPITGIVKDKRFVPRIKPFYFLTEKETATYAYLKQFPVKFIECPYSAISFRGEVRDLINSIEKNHPGTKHAIINSFLELLPALRNLYKESKVRTCIHCQEPSSGEICNTCLIVNKLKNA